MDIYIKAIEALAEKIIRLENELAEATRLKNAWFERYQELKNRYEPKEIDV